VPLLQGHGPRLGTPGDDHEGDEHDNVGSLADFPSWSFEVKED
jgi:hypothetical protein